MHTVLSQSQLYYGPNGNTLRQSVLSTVVREILNQGKNVLGHTNEETLKRHIEQGSFANTFLLEPLEGTIKIEDTRTLVEFARNTATLPMTKFIIVLGCDQLTRQAANSLLKLVEEPRPQVMIFLTTTNRAKVLATLRSRCQQTYVADELPIAHFEELENLYKKLLQNPSDVIAQKYLGAHKLIVDAQTTHVNQESLSALLKAYNA